MTKKERIARLEERVSDLELESALREEEREDTVSALLRNILEELKKLRSVQSGGVPVHSGDREPKGITTKQLIDEWVNGEEAAHE